MDCARGVVVFFHVLIILKSLGYLFISIVLLRAVYSVSTQLSEAVVVTLGTYVLAIVLGLPISSDVNSATSNALFTAVCYVTLVLAMLGLFLGIWGIAAAAKRTKCILTTTAFLLVLILAIEVVFAVFMGLGSNIIADHFTVFYSEKWDQVATLPLATKVWIPLGILIGLGCITLFFFIFTICLCCVRGKENYA